MLKFCDIWKSDETLPFPMAGKQETGSAALGMGGYHAARTGRVGTTLPATRSVDAPLLRTGKCRAARSGSYYAARNERYYVARNEKCYAAGNGTPVGHIPESNSATAIARSAGCQVCCIARSVGNMEFPFFC